MCSVPASFSALYWDHLIHPSPIRSIRGPLSPWGSHGYTKPCRSQANDLPFPMWALPLQGLVLCWLDNWGRSSFLPSWSLIAFLTGRRTPSQTWITHPLPPATPTLTSYASWWQTSLRQFCCCSFGAQDSSHAPCSRGTWQPWPGTSGQISPCDCTQRLWTQTHQRAEAVTTCHSTAPSTLPLLAISGAIITNLSLFCMVVREL